MYLELAESGELSARKPRHHMNHRRPVQYLPHPFHHGVMVREDQLDGLHEDDFHQYLSEYVPELSEFDYQQLSSRRKERKDAKFEAKMAKKAAKTEKKQSKADLRRAKGEAKIAKGEAKKIKAEKGQKTTFQDVIGGITDVAGAATGVIGAIKGDGATDQTSVEPVKEPSFFEKNKMAILIGGGVLVIGAIVLAMKKKK